MGGHGNRGNLVFWSPISGEEKGDERRTKNA